MKLTKQRIFSLIEEVIEEAIIGTSLHNLVAGSSLYDIDIEKLKAAAYISGQRNEPIEDLDDGDPWFAEKFSLLQAAWAKGRQWAKDKTASYINSHINPGK